MSRGEEEKSAEYAVGYKRPPQETRFKKGVSGNPAGSRRKPKKTAKNLKAEILNDLDQKVAVTENGRRRMLPRRQIVAIRLVNDALAGDPRARDQLIRFVSQPDKGTQTEVEDLKGAAKDAEILERFRKQIAEERE